MELTSDPEKPDADKPRPGWSDPKAAYAQFRPGLSPYLHYIHDLRAGRNQVPAHPDHGPDAGAELPWQLDQALRDLIEQSFR